MKGKDVKPKPQPSDYVVQHRPGAKPGEWQGRFVPATRAAKAAARRHESTRAASPDTKQSH